MIYRFFCKFALNITYMYKRLIISLLLLSGLIISSCSSSRSYRKLGKEDVFIPETEVVEPVSYEKAVEEHWKRQSEETKVVAKRNKMKSEMFNKQFKKKSSFFSFFRWNRNKMNDNALMDGVRDTR